MARYALIIASLLHDGGPPQLVSGPEIPYDEQKAKFKEITGFRVHEEYAKVEFVDNRRGTTKRHNFITPAEAKRRELKLSAEEKRFGKFLPESVIRARAEEKKAAEAKEKADKAKADVDAKAKADAEAKAKADADAKAKADAGK